MWVTSAEVGKVAEGPFPTSGPGRLPRLPRPALSNSLQQLSLGAARRPPDRRHSPHPWPAAEPASLYMYKLPIYRMRLGRLHMI